jgi:hypothetical protein
LEIDLWILSYWGVIEKNGFVLRPIYKHSLS